MATQDEQQITAEVKTEEFEKETFLSTTTGVIKTEDTDDNNDTKPTQDIDGEFKDEESDDEKENQGQTDDAGDEDNEIELTIDEKHAKIYEIIKTVAEDGDGLDIYQLASFRSKYQIHVHLAEKELETEVCCGIGEECQYFATLVRALVCGLTQIGTIAILLYAQIKTAEKGICDKEGDNVNRVLIFCYSLYISLALIRVYNGFSNQGLYQIKSIDGWTDLEIRYLDFKWIKQGHLINSLVLLASIWTSWIIIFLADDPVDIILNALAVFFITELDDFLVDKLDYDQLNTFIEKFEKYGKHFYQPKDLYYIYYKNPEKMSDVNRDAKNEVIEHHKKKKEKLAQDADKSEPVPVNDELRNQLAQWCKDNIYNDDARYLDELMIKFKDKKFDEINEELEEWKNENWYFAKDLDENDYVVDLRYNDPENGNDFTSIKPCEVIMICCTCGVWYCAGKILFYTFKFSKYVILTVLYLTMFFCLFIPFVLTVCY